MTRHCRRRTELALSRARATTTIAYGAVLAARSDSERIALERVHAGFAQLEAELHAVLLRFAAEPSPTPSENP